MPRVVWNVEPLVRVGRPRVGALDARDEVREAPATPPPRARRRRPRAARRRAACAASAISASGSKAPVLTLPACAQTIVGPSPSRARGAQRSGAHPSLLVCRDDLGRAEPEQPQRAVDRRVASRAGHHARSRGAPIRPPALDVPAGRVAARGRAAARPVKCAICAPVAKPMDASGGRPSRSTSQLAATSSTTDGRRAAGVEPAFWSQVESASPPRAPPEAAADHEAEVRGRFPSRLTPVHGGGEPGHHVSRVSGLLGQRSAERARKLFRPHVGKTAARAAVPSRRASALGNRPASATSADRRMRARGA